MYPSLFLGLALSVGAPAAKEPPKKEAPSIVGEWNGEKALAGGKEKPVPPEGIVFTFTADGMFKVKEGVNEKSDAATYKIDTKKSPAEIDLDASGKGSMLGIFKIDGDTLTICISAGKDGKRPTEFESPEGSRTMLMTFKRVKK